MKGGQTAICLLVAGFLTSCWPESDPLPFGSGLGFFESSHMQSYASKGSLRIGGIYRPARKSTWPTSVSALSEMCEKDIEALQPETRSDTFADFDQPYARHQLNNVIGAFFSSTEISPYIESVRIQYHGVTRHVLKDLELDRIRQLPMPMCRDFLFARYKDGYNLFLVSGLVVADKAAISIQYVQKNRRPKELDPTKIKINGMNSTSPEVDNTVVYSSTNVIIEVVSRKMTINSSRQITMD